MVSFIDEYHKLYERAKIWEKNTWLGIPAWKLPMDMMAIQELIVKTRPEFIVETGTGYGGSALFYASICELLGEGRIITIDIDITKRNSNNWGRFKWEDRIQFLFGSSTNDFIVDKVKELVGNSKCMVILDSWHTMDHVYKEMEIYSKFVSIGNYMIVEDTHTGKPGNPIEWKWDDVGPMGAVNKWLEKNCNNWEIDYECEKHLMSFNSSGYLKKIK